MERSPLLLYLTGLAVATALTVHSGRSFGQKAAIEDIQTRGTSQAGGAAGGNLEERVKKLERAASNESLLEMLRRMEELQNTVLSLRREVEELGHEVDGMKQRQRDIYLDIDRRVGQLEAGRPVGAAAGAGAMGGDHVEAAAPGSGDLPPPGEGPAAATLGLPPGGGGDQAAYEAAFKLLRQGQYDQAIAAFEVFLRDNPKSDYSANAQYWLGEANYVTRRFPAAEAQFSQLIKQYPDSSKVPDAALKLGFTYYETGKYADARKLLQGVVDNYPNTASARLAQERLQKMAKEGR